MSSGKDQHRWTDEDKLLLMNLVQKQKGYFRTPGDSMQEKWTRILNKLKENSSFASFKGTWQWVRINWNFDLQYVLNCSQ